MKIAVALMTCGREDYTARTLDSFVTKNPDRSRFALIHGDDASETSLNAAMAHNAGFQTVVQHRVRCGNLALRMAMIEAAAHFAEWVLILENDLESVRPFPWALFDHVAARPTIYCLRLFGRFKDAQRREPCKPTNQWDDHKRVQWTPLRGAPEPLETGTIHWSAQPSVSRVKDAIALHRKGKRDLGLTARVVNNVMVHIGVERTQRLRTAC